MIWLLILVIVTALLFEFINGFHDTANAIATSVATKVLRPRQAIALATCTNLLGAFWGTAVAQTIASGLVDSKIVSNEVLLAALIGAIVWNLVTWWSGIPSSSSHALIGGLCGAALATAHNDFSVIIWSQRGGEPFWESKGILWKVVLPMVSSPLLGFVIGWISMSALYITFQRARPRFVNSIFGKLQIFSAAGMGFMHGTNDAQKTMGIVALSLLAGTNAGLFKDLPTWLSFLRVTQPVGQPLEIAGWIKALCALTMTSGTACGGWRIIKTLGHKMVRLHPIQGFAAETSSSIVIFGATQLGIPVSTTHNIAASIMGVGASKRFGSVNWDTVGKILWAWVLTLPCSALAAYIAKLLIDLCS